MGDVSLYRTRMTNTCGGKQVGGMGTWARGTEKSLQVMFALHSNDNSTEWIPFSGSHPEPFTLRKIFAWQK